MYLINKQENRITKVEEKTFVELGFQEREHLQEWLANNPEALGEELLIIQKEFGGFDETKERLDLLALDKRGNLVIIENKLDDTGRDVTWQALKYASYCSTLSTLQIKEIYQQYLNDQGSDEKAEDLLMEFFEISDFDEISLNKAQTQRIILVARQFRKEVTSTVLWLLNYKVKIQCFRVTPYQLDEQLLLDIEQILPMKETEDYVISMAEKTQEDADTQEGLKQRYGLRLEFWKKLIDQMNESESLLCQNLSPSKESWLGAASGVGGIGLHFVATRTYARVEVYISRPDKDENKFIFDELYSHKTEVEDAFEDAITWERLDTKKASRIKYELDGVNILNEEDWSEMITFIVNAMIKFEKIFKPLLETANRKLKANK